MRLEHPDFEEALRRYYVFRARNGGRRYRALRVAAAWLAAEQQLSWAKAQTIIRHMAGEE
jgi:hypothetical protein